MLSETTVPKNGRSVSVHELAVKLAGSEKAHCLPYKHSHCKRDWAALAVKRTCYCVILFTVVSEQNTIKQNCPARIYMREIIRYPDFAVCCVSLFSV